MSYVRWVEYIKLEKLKVYCIRLQRYGTWKMGFVIISNLNFLILCCHLFIYQINMKQTIDKEICWKKKKIYYFYKSANLFYLSLCFILFVFYLVLSLNTVSGLEGNITWMFGRSTSWVGRTQMLQITRLCFSSS